MIRRNLRFAVSGWLGCFVAAFAVTVIAQQQSPDDRLFQAIRTNDLGALRTLARQGHVDAKDRTGLTPLVLATAFGTREAVELLIGDGANVNAESDAGLTPLHVAWRNEAVARLLLSRGANVNAKTALGATPLWVASSAIGTLPIVSLLLENGANLNVADNRGVTPLIAAAAVGNHEVASLLLSRGADPNAYAPGAGQKTATPLMAAARSRDTELVRALLARHVDVSVQSPDNDGIVKNGPVAFGTATALHFAVGAQSLEIVKLLLDAGASIDAADARGATPLMWAIGTDRPNAGLIRLLVDRGASTAKMSNIGETAVDWARKYNDPAVLSALELTSTTVAPSPSQTKSMDATLTSRDAVEKSLRLLRTGSGRVTTDGGCVACHAQPMTGAATHYASVKGWSTEPAAGDISQVVRNLRDGLAGSLQNRESGGLPETQEYNAFMMAALGMPASPSTEAFVAYLAAKQQRAGNWSGLSTRPPIMDGDVTRTALAIRTISAYGSPALKAEMTKRVARAAEWLAAQAPHSTEERAMQLLGLAWADARKDIREKGTHELGSLQRADGGWSQTPNLPSDAYATGQAVFTLRELGVPASNDVVQRGIAFLLRTQAADGSWYVRSRAMKIQPYFESGFPYGHDQWISQSGTAWATIALAASAPDAPIPTAAK